MGRIAKKNTIQIENTSGVKFKRIDSKYMSWQMKDDLTKCKVKIIWHIDDLLVIRDCINSYLEYEREHKTQWDE